MSGQNLVTAMLDPSPSPVSLLAMIRLNEILISSLIDTQTCQPLESYLLFVRMTLWPAFVKNMHVQIESVQHLHEGKGTKWGGGAPKDSTVQIIALRYAELFNAAVALSREQDEEIVFSKSVYFCCTNGIATDFFVRVKHPEIATRAR